MERQGEYSQSRVGGGAGGGGGAVLVAVWWSGLLIGVVAYSIWMPLLLGR